MAFKDLALYCNWGNGSSTGYFAVSTWSAAASIAVGALRRQSSPVSFAERIFVAVAAGTTGGSEPAWTNPTRGQKFTDNTVTWVEATGAPALNNDATNTNNWNAVKNTSVSQGQIIKNVAGTHYFIATTGGTSGNGSEPSWNTTAGATTADNGVTWTCLGAVGGFTNWGCPHAHLSTPGSDLASTTQASTIYVSHAHDETCTVDPTIRGFGSYANPGRYLCVNSAGSVPPVSADLRTTANVTTTNSSNFTIGSGSTAPMYYYGINFKMGSGSAGNFVPQITGPANYLDTCSLQILTTGSGTWFYFNTADALCVLKNTPFTFGHVGQTLYMTQTRLRWLKTTSALNGTIPTKIFSWSASNTGGDVECIGVDFSAAGAGKTLVDTSSGSARRAVFRDCKLDASVTKVGANQANGLEVDFWRSGSAGVNYNVGSYRQNGTLVEETTIIRTGGASDGTTGLSWNITTNANASFIHPFVSPPIAIWNDTVGSPVTATVEGIWGGGAVPNNDDIFIEAEYLGSSTSPLASFIDDAKADPLAAAAGHTASSATWGGSTTKFKMAVTFTPQQKGWVLVRVKAAKASSTFYIDPKVALS
ncbi:hypothetical protein [Mesorhizobium sp.]|uniref:hypothetical protein n=1 Tax=Mesorhizobium sp. TaxID=1871066 RepID=UPI000FE7D057|nr:hypothetical protein [Mesorhizobium sp.]RWB53632.1 MAG: hypothetical protein EOQ47_20505 [Mesorhizobium sp.]